ncbi:MAG: aminotransferase class IV [Bacteroidetes bacterium]|jgi:branched-chain amino acid aminotransferase|nr:aminotransferase class IV [Bacteroidota bacterium]MDA0878901.1 aminotransferase class IV [Bacteroidota bacterium]MDA1115112.1 aminotransferase class IV [Bacteroidota bacterium]
MINLNGQLVPQEEAKVNVSNRAFNYADAVFETMRIRNGQPLFFESHYFRLMANMRICRMEIPNHFTPEHLLSEITALVNAQSSNCSNARIKMVVFRDAEGLYTPVSNEVGYCITVQPLAEQDYPLNLSSYTVDIYKDFLVPPGLLSTVKTSNRMVNILGGIYAKENDFDNCLLLNTQKNVIEALNGNVFLVFDKTIKTPALSEGCLNGIMRRQIIELAPKLGFRVEEVVVSPFDIQQADEMFISNIIQGVRPVTNFRKKQFGTVCAQTLIEALNASL